MLTARVDSDAALLNAHTIVFVTLASSRRPSLKAALLQRTHGVDYVLVDESGQALEVELLCPLYLEPRVCCIVGDPNQLPATVLSERALERGLHRSAMQRLMMLDGAVWRATLLLTRQYRMHGDIVRWPSTQFYNDKLVSADWLAARPVPWRTPPSASPPAPPLLDAVQLTRRVVFVDVDDGAEQTHGTSFANAREAAALVALLDALARVGVVTAGSAFSAGIGVGGAAQPATSIGVITFYAAQVRLVQQSLARSPHSAVRVATVDSFQVQRVGVCLCLTV